MKVLSTISPRDRRTLLVGLIVIGTTLLISRGVPQWREWDGRAQANASDLRFELSNLDRQLGRLPAVRDSARARAARAAIARERLIAAPSAGSAGSALATKVTDVADEIGVKISAIQIRPDSMFKGNHARVAVRLTAWTSRSTLSKT